MSWKGMVFGVALIAGVGGAQTPSKQALATVDGQPIYEEMLPAQDQQQIERMMLQVNGVRMRALHAVIGQKLVEAEAKRRGISAEELFKAEVLAQVPEPSEEQMRAFYEERKTKINKPYDEAKQQMHDGWRALEIQKAREGYLNALLERAANDGELVMLVTPPKVDMPVDPARVKGDAKAPVTVVEFADFSCAYCKGAEPTMKELLAKYPGKVRVAYRDFPLRQIHPMAEIAAEASRCAGEQGKYWEYHDALFAEMEKRTREDLVADARRLGLDEAKFGACLSSGQYRPQVEADVQLGTRGGVMSTPGFFVNGRFVEGAQSEAAFEKMIDEELVRVGQKNVSQVR